MNMDIGLEPLYGRELILPGEQSIEGRIRIFEGCVNRKYVFSVVHAPEGPAPKGQENLAQGLYLFSVEHTARRLWYPWPEVDKRA